MKCNDILVTSFGTGVGIDQHYNVFKDIINCIKCVNKIGQQMYLTPSDKYITTFILFRNSCQVYWCLFTLNFLCRQLRFGGENGHTTRITSNCDSETHCRKSSTHIDKDNNHRNRPSTREFCSSPNKGNEVFKCLGNSD